MAENHGDPRSETDAHPYQIQCPIRDVLGEFGGKWSILVLMALNELGRSRFSKLRRHIEDISQRMLAATLRRHVRDGLVERTAYSEIPPRVEYELTPLGTSVIEPIDKLVRWVLDHKPELEQARRAYDERQRQGKG